MHNPVFSPDLQIKQIKAWNCCSCWKTAFNLLDQKSVCSIWRLPLIIILAEIHIFMAKLELTSWSNKISWQSIAISRICSCHKWCNTIVPWSANSPACPDTFLSLCLVTECDRSCSAALLTPNLVTKWVPQPWIHLVPAKGSGGLIVPPFWRAVSHWVFASPELPLACQDSSLRIIES